MHKLDDFSRIITSAEELGVDRVAFTTEELREVIKLYQDLYRECEQLRNELAISRSTQYH